MIQRMDHVGIVVDDLAAATAFFVDLGLDLRKPVWNASVGQEMGRGGARLLGSTPEWLLRTRWQVRAAVLGP